jgi:CelD/BcsL family acetyltransferase involved in cellulose biosynthesis
MVSSEIWIMPPSGDSALKFALYRPSEMSAELWQAYTALRNARAIYDDPFFDPDFARLVGEVREDTRIGVVTRADEVISVWPLHLRPGNWARPIGGPFSDWHAPIVKEGIELCPIEFLSGLGLSGMTAFGYMPDPDCQVPSMERVGANMTDLSIGWDAFMAEQQKRWPKHFKKMRRVYRNVERDFSGMSFEWDDRSDASYERLLELKRAQFKRTGFHDVLKPQWARDLLDRLRHFEGERFRCRPVSMSYDDKPAALELNLQSDKILHGWLTAFEPEMSQYSPGNMLVQEVLEKMAIEGVQIYDAGPGLDHYKRHYSNIQWPVETGVLRGQRGSFAPSRLAGRAWRAGEKVLPGKAGTLMARARRRMDQIALSETSLGARIGGAFGALSQREL